MKNRAILSNPIRTETAATTEDCQQMCEAAEIEGCISVNFNLDGQSCELLSVTAKEIEPELKAGTNFYEFCIMITPGGKCLLVHT